MISPELHSIVLSLSRIQVEAKHAGDRETAYRAGRALAELVSLDDGDEDEDDLPPTATGPRTVIGIGPQGTPENRFKPRKVG